MKKIINNKSFLLYLLLGTFSMLFFTTNYFLIRIEYSVSSLSQNSILEPNMLINQGWFEYIDSTSKLILYLPLFLAIIFFSLALYNIFYKKNKINN